MDLVLLHDKTTVVWEFSLVSLQDKGGESLRQVSDVTNEVRFCSVAGDYETSHTLMGNFKSSVFNVQFYTMP